MHRRVAIIVIASAVWLTGCGHSGSETKPTPPPTKTSLAIPNLSAKDVAERDALAAYRGMWDAWVDAGKTANPDAPGLRTYTGGEALKLIVGVLATNQHAEQVTLGNVAIDPRVSEVKPQSAPTKATVKDCVNTENWLNHKASGGLVNDIPGGRRDMTATATRVDGAWKVTAFQLGRLGTC